MTKYYHRLNIFNPNLTYYLKIVTDEFKNVTLMEEITVFPNSNTVTYTAPRVPMYFEVTDWTKISEKLWNYQLLIACGFYD